MFTAFPGVFWKVFCALTAPVGVRSAVFGKADVRSGAPSGAESLKPHGKDDSRLLPTVQKGYPAWLPKQVYGV